MAKVYFFFIYICIYVVVIPNAEEIQAARRQRSAIRAQKEFIPLSKDGRSSAGSTPDDYRKEDDEDRVNEDDDDDEPDDYERRIEFAPRLKTIKERIAEKLGKKKKESQKTFNILVKICQQ